MTMAEDHRTPIVRYSDPQNDIGNNPRPVHPIGEIIQLRLSRRNALKSLLASAAVAMGGGLIGHLPRPAAASTLTLSCRTVSAPIIALPTVIQRRC
jgi:hypothetical protein